MTLSLYDAAIPPFKRHLSILDTLLDKAAAYAEARKIDPAVLLQSRLYPDMFPLVRQVQLACDFSKAGAARLARVPVPGQPDVETTIPELKARLARTAEFLETIRPEQMEGAETAPVTIKYGAGELTFEGRDYLLQYALPNFYFHCATAFGILRHNGLEIGKRDFLGRK